MRTTAGIPFATIPGFRPLELDLYVPDNARAVCVYLHGGGWRVGSRRAGPGPLSPTSGRLFTRMASQGLAVASVDYRLSGEATFPAPLEDARAACAWVRAELPKLPLVLFGVSAGGHLAALCGLDPATGSRAVAAWYPVTDLLAMPDDLEAVAGEADRGPTSREALMLGAPAADDPELARAASPVTHVHPDAPPFLLLHGDADEAVPLRQSERLHDALAAAGVGVTLEHVQGQGHMFPTLADAEVEALVDRTISFLAEERTSP